jgi:hypothetical protein
VELRYSASLVAVAEGDRRLKPRDQTRKKNEKAAAYVDYGTGIAQHARNNQEVPV